MGHQQQRIPLLLPPGPACEKKALVLMMGRNIYRNLQDFLLDMQTQDARSSQLMAFGVQAFGSPEDFRTAIRMELVKDEMRLIYVLINRDGMMDVALNRMINIISGQKKF